MSFLELLLTYIEIALYESSPCTEFMLIAYIALWLNDFRLENGSTIIRAIFSSSLLLKVKLLPEIARQACVRICPQSHKNGLFRTTNSLRRPKYRLRCSYAHSGWTASIFSNILLSSGKNPKIVTTLSNLPKYPHESAISSTYIWIWTYI